MTLKELAVSYRDSARWLGFRIAQLKDSLEKSDDPHERCQLEARIKMLSTMHREAREIAVLCERYYERGYRRNAKYTI